MIGLPIFLNRAQGMGAKNQQTDKSAVNICAKGKINIMDFLDYTATGRKERALTEQYGAIVLWITSLCHS